MVLCQQGIHDAEVVIVVEDVQIGQRLPVGDALAGRIRDHQVENGKRIAQGAVGFPGDQVKRFGLCGNVLAFGDLLQMCCNVGDLDSVKVEYLAARQNGGQHLVLFRRGQNENGIWRRFLQRFEKSVEGRAGEHVNFVDYVDLEATVLRRVAHLVDQVADIVDGVVGRGVQFEDIQRVEFGLV